MNVRWRQVIATVMQLVPIHLAPSTVLATQAIPAMVKVALVNLNFLFKINCNYRESNIED